MIHHLNTIEQFYKLWQLPAPVQPLISVVDIATAPVYEQIESGTIVFGFYVLSFKSGETADAKYGQPATPATGGVLGFRAPGQVVKVEPQKSVPATMTGWMLCVHPDFLWHTPLAKTIRNYDFFYYALTEALFLSREEETIINTLVATIAGEAQQPADRFSPNITIALLAALLAYIERFYQRQFATDKVKNHQLLDKADHWLTRYFDGRTAAEPGLPTVAAVAEALHVSPHYLSAVLRSTTGKNTQQHIHDKLIGKAKELLSTTTLSVSEIAYVLGFEHLQSFSKLFKAKTHVSPVHFRQSFTG